MLSKVRSFLTRFRRDEDGVTLVEYGVAVAVAVMVGGYAATYLVPGITGAMDAATAVMPTTSTTTP